MNKDLETGIKIIDHQHQEFHAMLDTMMLEMMDQLEICNFKSINKYLVFLDKYIAKHFALEESIMEEFGFPDLDEHKQTHNLFTIHYKEFAMDLRNTSVITAEKLKVFHKFLLEWFNKDIREDDVKMAEFIRNRSKKNPVISKRLNELYKNSFAEDSK